LKNIPTNNQTTNFLPQSITLTPNSQQQQQQNGNQQQQYINTFTDFICIYLDVVFLVIYKVRKTSFEKSQR
ncbi:unnamed protein product, partial [Rotaria sp. Silwood1]